MNVELKVEGKTIVNAHIDVGSLIALLQTIEPFEGSADEQSTAISAEQAELLLQRIDPKSVEFLRQIAINNGFIVWSEMQKIFGIKDDTWAEFTSRHGKGITRALRKITGGKFDVLVHWNDEDPEWKDDDWSEGKVYVDGKALDSLRAAFKLK